jgi:hypothetical protein
MSFQGPSFVIAIILMCTLGWIVTTWIRAKHGYPIENEWGGVVSKSNTPDTDRKIELLSSENGKLVEKIGRLEERIAVLERIATDANGRAAQLSDQIDRLR